MFKNSQKGFAHILVLIILIVGLIAGVYLVQQTQIFKPKAVETFPNPIERFTQGSGCNDGTSESQCSQTKPKYCVNGQLIDMCSECGCESGTCTSSGYCTTPVAYEITINGKKPVAAVSIKPDFNEDDTWVDTAPGTKGRNPKLYDMTKDYLMQVSKDFYKVFGDDYDFLVILHRDFSLGAPFYLDVSNNIEGIGLEKTDKTQLYGSKGKLQGVIYGGKTKGNVENGTKILLHEIGHRWAVYIGALKDKDTAHYNPCLNIDNDIMFGWGWLDNGDGTFTQTTQGEKTYTDITLYLMGAIPAEEVGNLYIIDNPSGPDRKSNPKCMPYMGHNYKPTVSGVRRDISISEIIERNGRRNPDDKTSPKLLKARIVVAGGDGVLQQDEIDSIDALRNRFSEEFYKATHGKIQLEVE